jgi:hypothetical protein
MGRKVIDKVFDAIIRMDVTVRVHANTKDEAEAWVKERLVSSLTLGHAHIENSEQFIPLEMLPTIQETIIKKVKRPRRVKLTTVELPTGE